MTGFTKQEIVDFIHELQPDCLVNNRLGVPADYGTPEQEIPEEISQSVWETCMTMNDHWGYNKADQNFKSSETLIRNLIEISSKGGNFLLNVGPTAGGVFPPDSIERFAAMGQWMSVNGEAIHGTGPSPFLEPLAAWRCTSKPGKLFLHFFEWPSGEFVLDGVKNSFKGAFLLADQQRASLPMTQNDEIVTVRLPVQAPDSIASVLCLQTTE